MQRLLALFVFLSLTAATPSLVAPEPSNAWLEIDAQAFEGNIQALKAKLGETKICAVMKADAYGHSIKLLIPSVIKAELPCVAIASNEEARAVREGGFKGRLMRLRTATLAEVEAALPLGVEELVGNLAFTKEVAKTGTKHDRTVRVHIDLNAGGMSRNGLELATEQGKADAVAITKTPGIDVVGLMTHFPVEEVEDVKKVLALYLQQSEWLIGAAKLDRGHVVRHTANSFATLEVPEARLDMVRPGGALYGDTIPTYTEFKRVMSFKSRVAAVNPYPAGNSVGYDRTFVLQRDSRLANVPVGYSDGYRRVFSSKTFVLIRGKRFPVVGRVSMNTLMVDVTDDPTVASGDEVVLFGKQGDAEITQAELEKAADTILADLYTIWGAANPRILKPH